MHPMCSIKRSPPLTETEALLLQEENHLFGYKPEIMQLEGHWFLKIRGDGTDDHVLAARLTQLRRTTWTIPTVSPASTAISTASPLMARRSD